jgi:four helix bundle protein
MSLASEIYSVTNRLPRHEIFGLTSQLRRAAVSIPSNIAEGSARNTTRELLSFMHIARGSHAELETQIEIAASLGYLGEDDRQRVMPLIAEVGRLLTAIIQALRRRIEKRAPAPSTIR